MPAPHRLMTAAVPSGSCTGTDGSHVKCSGLVAERRTSWVTSWPASRSRLTRGRPRNPEPPATTICMTSFSVDGDNIHHEDQSLPGFDPLSAALAVAEVGRNHQQPAGALLHTDQALIPALDDAGPAEWLHRERLGPTVPRSVELLLRGPGDADI